MFEHAEAFSGFSVDDLDAAKSFYSETLGLEVSDDGPGLGLVLPSGATIFVYPKDDHRPASFTILNFTVDDIDAAVDDLTARGVEMLRYEDFEQDDRGIARPPHGPRIGWFSDPAGNVLAILER